MEQSRDATLCKSRGTDALEAAVMATIIGSKHNTVMKHTTEPSESTEGTPLSDIICVILFHINGVFHRYHLRDSLC